MANPSASIAGRMYTLNLETGILTVSLPGKPVALPGKAPRKEVELTSENLPQYFDIESTTILHRLLDKYGSTHPERQELRAGATPAEKARAEASAITNSEKEKEVLLKIAAAIIERIQDARLLLHTNGEGKTIMQAAISNGALDIQLKILDQFDEKSPGNKKDIFMNQEKFDNILIILKQKLQSTKEAISAETANIELIEARLKRALPPEEKEKLDAELLTEKQNLVTMETKQRKLITYQSVVMAKKLDAVSQQTKSPTPMDKPIQDLISALDLKAQKLKSSDPLVSGLQGFISTIKSTEYQCNAQCSFKERKFDEEAYVTGCHFALVTLRNQLHLSNNPIKGLFGTRGSYDHELKLIQKSIDIFLKHFEQLKPEAPPAPTPRGPGEASGAS